MSRDNFKFIQGREFFAVGADIELTDATLRTRLGSRFEVNRPSIPVSEIKDSLLKEKNIKLFISFSNAQNYCYCVATTGFNGIIKKIPAVFLVEVDGSKDLFVRNRSIIIENVNWDSIDESKSIETINYYVTRPENIVKILSHELHNKENYVYPEEQNQNKCLVM